MNIYVVNCHHLVKGESLGVREIVKMVSGKPVAVQETIKLRKGGTVVVLANSAEEAYNVLVAQLGIPDLEMEIVDVIPVDKPRVLFQHNI